MASFLAGALLALPLLAQDEAPPEPDPKDVEAALAQLEKAFGDGDSADRIRAIERGAEVEHATVIAALAEGLSDDGRDVRIAAIGALRTMNHPAALAPLAERAARVRAGKPGPEKAAGQTEELAALLRAVGQHADPSTIDLFAAGALSNEDAAVVRARVLSLGRIRTKQSVEALMALMRKAGRKDVQAHMGEFRLALVAATGVDHGRSQDLWLGWWNDRKKEFEAPEKEPLMPRRDKQAWDAYWGVDRRYPRATKRADRGKDPERGGE